MTDRDPLPQFGVNLRAAREQRGLSQEALAQRAGMDPAEIRRLEGARRDPGVRVLTRLARALDTEPSDLLKGVR
jgi:transcriptional regulator with XRE-family HTH domain